MVSMSGGTTRAVAPPLLVLLLLAACYGSSGVTASVGPAQPSGGCSYVPENATVTCPQQFEQIAPPDGTSKAAWERWMSQLRAWREEARANSSYPSRWYDEKGLAWARTSFLQPQTMLHDRYLFDESKERGGGEGWTVDTYLDDLEQRYGGVDSVLLWHSYPNIGIDDRNQFDMLDSLPGGRSGVRRLVADFHARGVHVLLPYNPWDQGTRPTGVADHETMVRAVIDVGADGFNGDTMPGINMSFMDVASKLGRPLAFEPEFGMDNISDLAHDVLSWGYWNYTPSASLAPAVSSYKFVENRHLVHISERWAGGAGSRMNGLQHAFFNGIGYETWENVWGLYNQISERDAFLLKAGWTVLRHFGELVSGKDTDWLPHVPIVAAPEEAGNYVFASQFSNKSHSLWTFVNRNTTDSVSVDKGFKLRLSCSMGDGDERFFDLFSGKALSPGKCVAGTAVSDGITIQPGGLGSVLRVKAGPGGRLTPSLTTLLSKMANLTSGVLLEKLGDAVALEPAPMDVITTKLPPQVDAPAEADDQQESNAQGTPNEMVRVEGEHAWRFMDSGNEIEGDPMPAWLDVWFPWELSGGGKVGRTHTSVINIPTFYIDKMPVTNDDYAAYLESTNWKPRSTQNWLKHWNGKTVPPTGTEKQPVTWVSYADAQSYCLAQGKRLPHSAEWQLAAQGVDGRRWPWGDSFDEAKVPKLSTERVFPQLADVDAHPDAASPYGVLDLVGNVYQWTDRFVDNHTAKAILRGGNSYHPIPYRFNPLDPAHLKHTPGNWYFPNPMACLETETLAGGSLWWRNCPQNVGPLAQHNIFLLLSDSMDRSAGIGFRCAMDGAPTNCTTPWITPGGPCPPTMN